MSSGVKTLTVTRNELIKQAFVACELYSTVETLSAEDQSYGETALNQLIKHLQNSGASLWSTAQMYVWPVASQAVYKIGGSGYAKCTESFVQTATSAAAVSGAGSISVTSATGMTIGDVIGILKDSNTIFWTTISNIVTTTISLTANLDGDTASGNKVYTFTSYMDRILRVLHDQAFYRNSSGYDRKVVTKGRTDYNAITNKTSTGEPNTAWYDPRRDTYGELHIWPTPTNEAGIMWFTVHKRLDIFTASTDNPDIPEEWIMFLKYTLAAVIATDYPVSNEVYTKINGIASGLRKEAMDFDTESESLILIPDMR